MKDDVTGLYFPHKAVDVGTTLRSLRRPKGLPKCVLEND
jgi:hypothetical protein